MPATIVTSAELAELAYSLDVSLGEAARKLSEEYPDALLPHLDTKCSDITVGYGIHDALLQSDGDVKWDLSPASIVVDAHWLREPLGDFVGKLVPFRDLGAPVPAFDEAIREILNAVELDDYDSAMLAEYDEAGDSIDLDTITALTLVRIAGRFGWTPAYTHERLTRLILVGVRLDYPTRVDLPDEIVYWYDLLALTTYFDGQPPVISGPIDWPYLERAAEEIFDCPPEEIRDKAVFLRDRLRIYADLFELDLPEEPASA